MAAALGLSGTRALPARQAAFRGTALRARPAALPRRAAARVAQTVEARAAKTKQAYICIDCGYLYDGGEGPFEKLPNSYRCPVCNAPKRRFKPYTGGAGKNDQKSMDKRYADMQKGGSGGGGKGGDSSGLLVGLGVGVAGLVALYVFLSSQYN